MPKPAWLDERLAGSWLWPEFKAGERELTEPGAKVVVGQFFEAVAIVLYKGKYGPTPEGWELHPDMVLPRRWRSRDVLVEVKGGGMAYGFLIDHGQHGFYEKIMDGWWPKQLTDEQIAELSGVPFVEAQELKALRKPPFNKPMSYYLFFIHDQSRMSKSYKTVDELIAALRRSIRGAMLVPVEIVGKWIEWLPTREYTGWCWTGSRGGEKHPFFARLSAYQMLRWINGTVDVHDAFNDLAAKDDDVWFRKKYVVNRYYVTNVKILRKGVNPFMLMVMWEPGSWKGQPKGSREVKFL